VRADDPADTPYLKAEQAALAAYASEVALAHGRSRLATICGGHAGYLYSHWQDIEPLERVAQGAICLALIRRAVSAETLQVLDAVYTFAETRELCARKNHACNVLAQRIAEAVKCPHMYVQAHVMHKAGAPIAEEAKWAKALGVTERTLQHWRNGRGQRLGILPLFKGHLSEALHEVEQALLHAGLMFRGTEAV
jgi:hypothetical protein